MAAISRALARLFFAFHYDDFLHRFSLAPNRYKILYHMMYEIATPKMELFLGLGNSYGNSLIFTLGDKGAPQ